MSVFDVISFHQELNLPDNRLRRDQRQFKEFVSTTSGGACGGQWWFEVDEHGMLWKVTDNWFVEQRREPQFTREQFKFTGFIWVFMVFNLPDPGFKEWWQYRDYLEVEYRKTYPSSRDPETGEHEWRVTFTDGILAEMVWRDYLPEDEQLI